MLSPQDLRRRRKALGLAQRVLAEELRVTTKTIGNWEREKYPISPAHQYHLEKVLSEFEAAYTLVHNARQADEDDAATPFEEAPQWSGISRMSDYTRSAYESGIFKSRSVELAARQVVMLERLDGLDYEELFDQWLNHFIGLLPLEIEYARRRNLDAREAHNELWDTLLEAQQSPYETKSFTPPWRKGTDADHGGESGTDSSTSES